MEFVIKYFNELSTTELYEILKTRAEIFVVEQDCVYQDLDWKNVPLISGLPMGFTDDTVMTLAIKKALVSGSDLVETMVEVGRKYPVSDYEYSIGYSLDEIRPRYKWNESCQGSVPVAMRCFYESTDYESFIRNIFSLECDSDTFGAIAGGVAEKFYGGFGSVDTDGILREYLDEELMGIMNA